jgi:hypothetical protein
MAHALSALHAPHIHAVAVHGLSGEPLAWGFIVGALGVALWMHEHHWQRFTAWCFAISAGCFTVAIPPLFDALAALTTTGAGLTWLAIIGGLAFTAFYLQAVRTHKPSRLRKLFGGRKKGTPSGPGAALAVLTSAEKRPNRHRRIGTPLVSIITGALFAVVVGGWRLLLKNAGTSAAATLKSIAQSSRTVNSGSAAKAIPPGHRPEVYMIAAGAVLLIAFLMRTWEKRRQQQGRGGKGQPQRGGGFPVISARGNS